MNKPKENHLYSADGRTIKGLKIYLPVVRFLGTTKSNVTGKWCDSFRRQDTGGNFTFQTDEYKLGKVDWEGEVKCY